MTPLKANADNRVDPVGLADLETMILIREAELRIAGAAAKQVFKTPIHLAIGQEAVSVGITKWLTPLDSIFGNHRSHAHYLSGGGSLAALFSEILGRKSGASGGKGGSMHLKSPTTGLIGTMPIVAGTIPIAVGSALSKRRPNRNDISVIFFGDGAVEEGVFHESLNLSRMLNLPIVFVCENNIYSSHLHVEERQPSSVMSRFATANSIESFIVDGNDVTKVSEVARSAISYCRKLRQPVMIEANTYRLYGHVGYQKDENVGLRRLLELPEWEKRDPILQETQRVLDEFISNAVDLKKMQIEIQKYVENTWQHALLEPYPPISELFSNVYFEENK